MVRFPPYLSYLLNMKRKRHPLNRFFSAWLVLILLIVLTGNGGTGEAATGSLKVLYPNGGEVIKGGSVIALTWQSEGMEPDGKVVIILYKNGLKHSLITAQTRDNGNYSWKISTQLPEGNDYRIRIRSLADLAVNDFSDQNFSIVKTL